MSGTEFPPDPDPAPGPGRFRIIRRLRGNLFLLIVLIACIVAISAAIGKPATGPVSPATGALLVVFAVVGITAGIVLEARLLIQLRRRRHARQLARIAAANRTALPAPAAQPATPAAWGKLAPGAAAPAAFRYSTARAWPTVGLVALLAAGAVVASAVMLTSPGGIVHVLESGLACVLALLLLLGTGLCARTLIRWALPGRPVLTMDADGVRFAVISFSLPWAELAEIRLYPIPSSQDRWGYARSGQPARKVIMAFVPARPVEVSAALRLGWFQRLVARRSRQLYGTDLTITDRLLDHTGEQIVAAVARFAPVQVRRYD